MQTAEIEQEISDHSLSSTAQNGRINAAYARKKKRLDDEFERLVGVLEERRKGLSALDHQAGGVVSLKGGKEVEVTLLEREVAQILKEQLIVVQKYVQQGEAVSKSCLELITKGKFPWPPKGDPTADDVTTLLDDWEA